MSLCKDYLQPQHTHPQKDSIDVAEIRYSFHF